jgi:hypothetical protein
MSRRPLAVMTLALLSTVLTVVGLVLLGLTPRERVPVGLHVEESYPFIFIQLSLGAVGAVVAWRHRANPIGWLLSAGGFAASLEYLAAGYMTYGLLSDEGLPLAHVVGWFWGWGAVLIATCIVPVLFLFPDGQLRSRNARAGIVISLLAMMAAIVVQGLRPGPILGIRFAENPFGWRDGERVLDVALISLFVLGLPAVALIFSTLRARARNASYLERQQLKWLYGGFGLFGVTSMLTTATLFGDAIGVAVDPLVSYLGRLGAGLAFSIIPIAIGIAIVRYGLYDIDLLINRTLVYGATTAAIAATFFLGILTLTQVLRPITQGNELAVAASTLASFALFQPIRRRVQDAVDRRFDRSRYDASRTLDAFADQLRDEVDLDTLRADLIGAVRQTMAPAHASLWLREGPR